MMYFIRSGMLAAGRASTTKFTTGGSVGVNAFKASKSALVC